MIILKNNNEIQKMKVAGRIVEEALRLMEANIRPGISTAHLDRIAEEFITKQGAVPSFKGYGGFPGSICASVNDVVIHGIPSKEVILKDGDIISVDMGAMIDRYHGDAARTFAVGEVSQTAKDLIRITEESFFKGVEMFREGGRLGDISHAIGSYLTMSGYGVVRDYVGHGIGRNLHEQPNVPNYGKPGAGVVLREGMVLAIEPMVNVGSYEVKVLKDQWTVKTVDGSLSAHYENTVALTSGGPQLLTLTI
ncbi:type I methionyl aminopeptidase [Proteiniclasticum sp. QWL-01]|uniref:type I methionyl aminopeptidase n=1 Tax=Proteiniclasticum sp. QWL-01 TaxID=3036945 RepID=UPI0024111589|nr:type I methionyl aminopeptidase [Proteiniclasticum sp. QWL-01]WFF73305.1 type I methionyl aminopeptidase [Proteiniclasticum sp. QWL-01]